MSTSYVPSAPIPLPDRRTLQTGALVAMALLLVLVAIDGWLPHVVTRVTTTGSAPAATGHVDDGVRQAERAGIDVDAAISQARHTPSPIGTAGALEATDPAYKTTFDRAGFTYRTVAGGTLALQTPALSRGSENLPVQPSAWSADGNAAVRDLAPGVQERVTNRTGEIEWDVVLAHRPAGTGAFRVETDLDGTTSATRTTVDGRPAWRMRLAGGGSVVIDEVVVLDANGTEVFRGMPTLDGGELTLSVPASVLDAAAYPLTIDPTVSGGRGVNVLGSNPAIAFNGTDYMVVWQEPFNSESDIYGARLDKVGAIKTQRFGISTDSYEEAKADISWNGQQFLVVFERRNNAAPNASDRQYDVYGQRVGEVGGLIGSNFPVRGGAVGGTVWSKRRPSVSSNGLDWYVVWEDSGSSPGVGTDIFGKTVTRNGVVGLATGIARTGVTENYPDVAWNGGTYLVVFTRTFSSTDHDIIGQRVSPFIGFNLEDGTKNGDVLGGSIAIATSSADQASAGVASEGYNQLPCGSCADPTSRGLNSYVTWNEIRGSDWDMIGTRISGAGSVLDPGGKVIVGTTQHETSSSKGVTFNGVYFVAWVVTPGSGTNTAIWGARVDKSANVLDSPALLIQDTNQPERNPAVSRGDGTNWGVAYEAFAPGDNNGGVVMRQVAPK